MKTVTVSSKGQISLPADLLRNLEIEKGSRLVLIQKGEQILLVPEQTVARLVEDELAGFHALAEPAFQDLWDNEADEVWDDL